jgi:hypothetical protein
MKKIFFSVLFSVIFLNVIYKSYFYFSFKKITAEVVDIQIVSKLVGQRNSPTIQHHFTPIVTYVNDSIKYQIFNENWGKYSTFSINEKVTLLVPDKLNKEIYLCTFLDFWCTENNIIYGFFIIMILSVILIEKIPEKKEKIRTWK